MDDGLETNADRRRYFRELVAALKIECNPGQPYPRLCSKCEENMSRGPLCSHCLRRMLNDFRFHRQEQATPDTPIVTNDIIVDDDGTPPDLQ